MEYAINTGPSGYKHIRIQDGRKLIPLINLSDTHCGSETYDEKCFDNVVKTAKDTESLIVLLGDMMENSTKHSVADGWVKQIMTPQQQLDYLCDKLEPIKNQIIAACPGNHEYRSMKDVGLDLTAELMSRLQITDRYFKTEIFATISGDHSAYSYYGVHSGMSNKTSGLAVNASQRDIMPIIRQDIIARAHCHKNIVDYVPTFQSDFHNNQVNEVETLLICTGHYLNRAESYASQKPCQSSPKGTHLLWLDTAKYHVKRIKPERIGI